MAYKLKGLVKGTKLKPKKTEQIILGFANDMPIGKLAISSGVSRVSVARLYRELMRRLVEDPIVNGGVWSANIPAYDLELWAKLYDCIYKCPADRDESEFRRIEVNVGKRKAYARRYVVREAGSCGDQCDWKLDTQKFSESHYAAFIDLRWQNRRITKENFRDVYYTKLFRINYMDSGLYIDGIEDAERVSDHELVKRFKNSFANNPTFITR